MTTPSTDQWETHESNISSTETMTSKWKISNIRPKNMYTLHSTKGSRDPDHMVVGFTTTYAISTYHH